MDLAGLKINMYTLCAIVSSACLVVKIPKYREDSIVDEALVQNCDSTDLRTTSLRVHWRWLLPSQRRWFSESYSSHLTGSRCYSQICRSVEKEDNEVVGRTFSHMHELVFSFISYSYVPYCCFCSSASSCCQTEFCLCLLISFIFLFDFLPDEILLFSHI